MSSDIITVNQAVKRFRDQVVLDHVTVAFAPRQIHGIVGRNGSGKTVLFKSICGLMPLDGGEITVRGQRLGKDIDVARQVGIIIEAPGFLPNYNGFQNLRMLAMIQNRIGRDQIRDVIRLVGLDPDSRKPVGKYSMGMRQRLGIAQAIMEDPDILILDEPMNGLDKQGVAEIRQLLLHLKSEGKTILLASHNKDDIDLLCDTVHEMDGGRIERSR